MHAASQSKYPACILKSFRKQIMIRRSRFVQIIQLAPSTNFNLMLTVSISSHWITLPHDGVVSRSVCHSNIYSFSKFLVLHFQFVVFTHFQLSNILRVLMLFSMLMRIQLSKSWTFSFRLSCSCIVHSLVRSLVFCHLPERFSEESSDMANQSSSHADLDLILSRSRDLR